MKNDEVSFCRQVLVASRSIMDSLVLTFKDSRVEALYQHRILMSLKNFDISGVWWILRLLILIHLVAYTVHESGIFYVVCLSVVPLPVYVVQAMSSDKWFLKYGMMMRMIVGCDAASFLLLSHLGESHAGGQN